MRSARFAGSFEGIHRDGIGNRNTRLGIAYFLQHMQIGQWNASVASNLGLQCVCEIVSEIYPDVFLP